MSLEPGQQISHYRLVEKIGEGGMGVVWKAEDTRLGRQVAIKVLPESLSADPERLARLDREARMLASLNHPSIAGIHSFEHVESTHFLVMELVEGEDLFQRLGRGPIPPEEARGIALQIATALEAAHDSGIVHRDLKPANIKLGAEDRVKVLDFGLAKALSGDPSGSDFATTVTTPMTREGTTLGTPAYMSPEQVKGKPADRRSDIWAFGCVLYEMLSGRRPFHGDTISEVLAAVLRDDIDMAMLPPATPPEVRQLLGRCLDREPRTRLQSIAEARIALEHPPTGLAGTTGSRDAGAASRSRWPTVLVGAVLILAGVAIGVMLPRSSGRRPATGAATRLFLEGARGRAIGTAPNNAPTSQAISPDGRWIAYRDEDRLFLRNLRELEAREVPDSVGVSSVFWSPRSDAVAFSLEGRLMKFAVDGARPSEICPLSGGDFSGGSWSADGSIVFTLAWANWDGDVLRVPEAGGVPEEFVTIDTAAGERRLLQPHFLPDGRTLLYAAVSASANMGEVVVDRDGVRTPLGLGNGSSQPAWSPTGHLVFVRSDGLRGSLWAVPFSLDELSATGDPFLLAEGGAGPTVAADGTLLYEVRHPSPQQLVWVDRTGALLGAIGDPVPGGIWTPSISPDGTKVAATIEWNALTVWNLERGVQTRISDESERVLTPEWLPGGEEIAYMLLQGSEELRVRRAEGGGAPRVLLEAKAVAAPSYSRDGRYLAYYVVDPETRRDLWAVSLEPRGEPFPILRTAANEALPRLSPDGSLLAYQSDASGRWEVYVQPFPDGEERWQISSGGGEHPRWSGDGSELFFVSHGTMMATSITTSPKLRFGTPQSLFDEHALGTKLSLPRYLEYFYDVAPDGKRFVVVQGILQGTSDLVVAEGLLP